jgi:UDP-N-acetyl-D-mannosaminuronic acid transferase (WecB/TagA/CpsF family)
VVPDGIGVVWAARQLGFILQERVTGIDLTCRIFEEGHKQGWRIFLLGARPGLLKKRLQLNRGNIRESLLTVIMATLPRKKNPG